MNAENGENTCVNDPIPLGYIQFNSTTSRSKDLSVPILICFYQYFVVFFIVAFNTRPLSFFIGEIIFQRTFFHTFFLILMLVKHHKIVSSCRFTESFVCSFNYLIFFLLFEFNTKLQWAKEKERH